ncbi:hypothetical protein ACROYT_G022754 [Oculina patagonica]
MYPWVKYYGCQIHYDTGTLVVGNIEIPIRYCKVKPSVCRIFLCADVEVEPGTEQVIGARLEEGYEQNFGSPGILEGSKELRRDSEICIARSLVVPKAGQTPIRVANFSDKPVRLHSDIPIAEYQPISCVNGSVIPTEVDPNLSSPSYASCSAIDMMEERDKQANQDNWMGAVEPNFEGLLPDQKEQFSSLMKEYKDIFAVSSFDLGKTDLMEHEINTGGHPPMKQPPRRVPPHQREIIDKQLDELLASGKVEESQSPWSSPVVLARKHDGSYRMCIDFQKLNQCTEKDAIPLPRTDDALEAVGGAQWFTCLDLASGYWQLQVKEEDRPKTAFSTHRGQFQWKVMPFGLTNGPASFTRLMNLALSGLTWTHCLVYLDDIIIWASTLEEHLYRLSYYRRFISGFSIIAEPLYKLCRKGVQFDWQQEQQTAFEELKHRLVSAPVLAYPDFSSDAGTFILDTDASQQLGIGAVLSQLQPDGAERAIAYGSRSLNDHEKNYCATRLEMLALVTYIDHFRYYLLGRRFRVRTDHHSLTWLMSFKEPQGQVARWLERLQEYDYEVTYRPGKQHCNADALSRRPRRNHGECPSCVPSVNSQVAAVTGTSQTGQGGEGEGSWSQEAIAQAQREDPDIGPVVEQLSREWKKPTFEELQCSLRKNEDFEEDDCKVLEAWSNKGGASALFGVPDSIHSDQGSNFESKVFEEMCRMLEIRKTRSTTYHLEGNGQVENIHKTLKAMLKARIEENPKSWDEHLDYCMMAYRSSVHASTELKPGEASKFHRQWEGPYLVEKVGGRSRKSKVVHFNNLRLYERKSEGVSERAMTDAVRSSEGDDTEVVEGECEHEPQVQDSDVLEDSGYQSLYTDVLQSSLVERGAGGDPVVGMPAAKGDTGGDSVVDENVEGTDTIQPGGESEESLSGPAALSGEENGQSEPEVEEQEYASQRQRPTIPPGGESKKSLSAPADLSGDENGQREPEVEEQEYASQSQRPVRVRKPPDRYGEWVVNSLQQITDRLQMLEDQQAMEKERLRKLKPKLLKKARALRAQ